MIVEPTNFMPRFFKSFEMASDRGEAVSYTHLDVYKRQVYTMMLIDGTLNRDLADINQQAEQMFHRLIEKMVQKQGVTEQLKA